MPLNNNRKVLNYLNHDMRENLHYTRRDEMDDMESFLAGRCQAVFNIAQLLDPRTAEMKVAPSRYLASPEFIRQRMQMKSLFKVIYRSLGYVLSRGEIVGEAAALYMPRNLRVCLLGTQDLPMFKAPAGYVMRSLLLNPSGSDVADRVVQERDHHDR